MNIVEIGLAFLEGLALIASPCILPVLPLVLSASVDGGRARPFGIITGFVLSFSAFALLSRQLVTAFHIDLDIIKNVSLALLAAFGLVLLSGRLSAKFSEYTQGAANLGSKVAAGGKDGFLSGIGIGALIGLVWTPCAGPILAAVLVQVIRQQNNLAGIAIILAFAIGAGLPMLAIALTGRKLMSKLGFFTTHAETVRKAFGIIILVSVAFIASGVDAQSLLAGTPKPVANAPLKLQEALPNPYPAPDFAGGMTWLNSPPLSMAQLKGKVVLVDFWTYSCINCVRTLPYITQWDKKYRDKGLVIVGVHSPEFEFEKKAENVKAALLAHGIAYPVALDNDLATWSNFHNQYWPAHYLIDRSGQVVYTHFGEGNYTETEDNIRYLLGLKDKAEDNAPIEAPQAALTPETYLGYARAERGPGVTQDAAAQYHFPESLQADHWALAGDWRVEAQEIVAQAPGAALRLSFQAGKVFLVLGSADGTPISVRLMLNGKPAGELTVQNHTLYPLIDQRSVKPGLLELRAHAPGLEAYAFTFGD